MIVFILRLNHGTVTCDYRHLAFLFYFVTAPVGRQAVGVFEIESEPAELKDRLAACSRHDTS